MQKTFPSQRAIEQGVAAFQKGRFKQAYDILVDQAHPMALNVAGVCAQRLGQTQNALSCYERAHALAPRDAEVLNNWGHFEISRGNVTKAQELFAMAIAANPQLVAAHIGIAKIYQGAPDWPNAKIAWEGVLKLSPNSETGHYGLGMALLELSQAQAAVKHFQAVTAGKPRRGEVAFMLGRAYIELNAFDRAETELVFAYNQKPADYTLKTLASLYWMLGQVDKFTELVVSAPDALVISRIKILMDAGELAAAQTMLNNNAHILADDADAQVLAAQIAQENGHTDTALNAAQKAISIAPDNIAAQDALVSSQLMCGRAADAMRTLEPLQKAQPDAKNWLAHKSVALRLMGVESSKPEIRSYTIPTPDGFASLEAFNIAFAALLRAQHNLKQRPLDQSLRGGTQTTRDLLGLDSPIVRAYEKALDTPIRAYLEATRQMPNSHDAPYKFAGMWSICLQGQGFHAPHFHPNGWISSAYYVEVPKSEPGGRDGWIYFGKPAYKTRPELAPTKEIEPKAGMLVLFPSHVWHGTYPTKGDSQRLTAPFDLIPNR